MSRYIMKRLLFLPFDQLHRERGVLRNAAPANDRIVMVQNNRFIRSRPWHRERLFFLISSAQHFAEDLRHEGFVVDYIESEDIGNTLKKRVTELKGISLVAAEPSSFALRKALTHAGAAFVPNDFFLTPREFFEDWARSQKSFMMENFYRKQRSRLNVLMDGGKPVGGAWNFDADNRLPPPKNHAYEPPLEHEWDEIDQRISESLESLSSQLWGHAPSTTWATTRAGALKQLDHFLQHHFVQFGPYEDAMPIDSWAVHHSLLSPYLNNGLLHAEEVIHAALERFNQGDVPLSSCEGFVRQIIGWREYINGMYWFLGEDYRMGNGLNASEPLPPVFRDASSTQMACMGSVIRDLETRSWVHHIPRLMVLSNLALLTGTNPQEFLDWMRETFIDAADWVMVPNVIGMGVHADGGKLMTKPYAAGGAYISRMSNYCKGCVYNPKNRSGDDACPFTTLYWDFLDRNREAFSKNHRMMQQLRGLDRLTDLEELRLRANEVKVGLRSGKI